MYTHRREILSNNSLRFRPRKTTETPLRHSTAMSHERELAADFGNWFLGRDLSAEASDIRQLAETRDRRRERLESSMARPAA